MSKYSGGLLQKQRNWISEALWKPKSKLSLEQLKYLYYVLTKNSVVSEQNRDLLVETLRSMAEILIWGDQNDAHVFDFFLEKNMLSFFLKIMRQKYGRFVCVQLLQTLNILFENIRNETSLYYLLSNNHINAIIVHKFDFSDEEVLAYYISFLRTLSLKLNQHTIHFFYNEHLSDFPLYSEAIQFFNHSEGMVRIAVRTVSLNVYRVNDESMLEFICNHSAVPYFSNLVWFIGSHVLQLDECVCKTANHLQRGRLEEMVAEQLDHLHYINDIICLNILSLNNLLVEHLLNRLLIPLYVYSLDPNHHGGEDEPRISSMVALFLLAQMLLVVNHSPLVRVLAEIILHGEELSSEAAASVAKSSSVMTHQRCPSLGSVRAFVPPEEHFGMVTGDRTPAVRHSAAISARSATTTDGTVVTSSVKPEITGSKGTPDSSRRSSMSSFVEIDRDDVLASELSRGLSSKHSPQMVGNSKFYSKASPLPPRATDVTTAKGDDDVADQKLDDEKDHAEDDGLEREQQIAERLDANGAVSSRSEVDSGVFSIQSSHSSPKTNVAQQDSIENAEAGRGDDGESHQGGKENNGHTKKSVYLQTFLSALDCSQDDRQALFALAMLYGIFFNEAIGPELFVGTELSIREQTAEEKSPSRTSASLVKRLICVIGQICHNCANSRLVTLQLCILLLQHAVRCDLPQLSAKQSVPPNASRVSSAAEVTADVKTSAPPPEQPAATISTGEESLGNEQASSIAHNGSREEQAACSSERSADGTVPNSQDSSTNTNNSPVRKSSSPLTFVWSDEHIAHLQAAYEDSVLQLRLFYKGPQDEIFLDMFEDEYYNMKEVRLNVEYLMMDAFTLLPPTGTPLTGIEFAKRLPCGEVERARRAMQVFFLVRQFCIRLLDEVETALPLSQVEGAVAEGDTLDLNNSDLIACSVITSERQVKRFLVIGVSQLILVEPDTSRLGWGVVRFVAFLQDVVVSQDNTDNRSLQVCFNQPLSSLRRIGQRKPQRKAVASWCFQFDDHIRCSAARKRLNQACSRVRSCKYAKIARLLQLPNAEANPAETTDTFSPTPLRFASVSSAGATTASSSAVATASLNALPPTMPAPLSLAPLIIDPGQRGESVSPPGEEIPLQDLSKGSTPLAVVEVAKGEVSQGVLLKTSPSSSLAKEPSPVNGSSTPSSEAVELALSTS